MSSKFSEAAWHCVQVDRAKFPCKGAEDDCGSDGSPGQRRTNYYLCKPCRQWQALESKRKTIEADDINRAEAGKRLKLGKSLPVGAPMRELHKAFRKEGGNIWLLTRSEELPKVIWDEDRKFIKGVFKK
tara:strand:+ start:445 stop:831 length:387 start_codon:yes stop_codon:yes gene_type:complete